MRVLRARLQDLLFSTRDPDHANASLRQVLREIRITLRDYRDALVSGPGWVGLDGSIVRLDMTARPGPDGQMPEFAADLDIPDPEFEDWLRDARMHAEQAVTPAAPEPSLLPVLLIALAFLLGGYEIALSTEAGAGVAGQRLRPSSNGCHARSGGAGTIRHRAVGYGKPDWPGHSCAGQADPPAQQPVVLVPQVPLGHGRLDRRYG